MTVGLEALLVVILLLGIALGLGLLAELVRELRDYRRTH